MEKLEENRDHSIRIPSGKDLLDGLLYIPKNAKSLVLFVHGSGSSRFSSRNLFVAKALNDAKHATLLFDLLTAKEDAIDNVTGEFRFDINLLASRLLDATHWCEEKLKKFQFNIGYFGASTGGGAALVAAAKETSVKAVVSRGGRPDLALDYLSKVKAPTLFIVGGYDEVVIQLNEKAKAQMTAKVELKIVPAATHLFEEPGKLEEVAVLAREWFDSYLLA